MGWTSTEMVLAVVAFVFAALGGIGLGWVGASFYWGPLLRAVLAEASAERRELATRIQGWEPERAAPSARAGGAASQPGSQPAKAAEWDAEYLAELELKGIRPNPDGGWWDLNCRWLFDTVEDIEAWRAMLVGKKLPITLNPGLAKDEGFDDALELAHKYVAQEKEKRIAEQSGEPVETSGG